jgi:uncharacterized repeat protein (TIGR01451 family)
VHTVPKPEELFTPTNTPFPTPTPVGAAATPTPTRTKESAQPEATETTTLPPAAGGVTDNPPTNLATTTVPTVTLSGVVTVTLLELRKAPAAEARIVDTAFHGDSITILGRNSDSSWWLICCGSNQHQGWVLAQAIQPNFNPSVAQALIPLLVLGETAVVSNTVNTAGQASALLQLEMRPSPAFVWQGQQFDLQLVVTNLGSTPATNVSLRDDLPKTLRYLKATVRNQGHLQTTRNAEGGAVFRIDWAQLAPGAKVTAVITLQVAPDAVAGTLIDNLAVVKAQQAADVAAGITLAMPPTLAPQFR